ncbi:MAG: tetratricopeptide repeat protein [bacterium]
MTDGVEARRPLRRWQKALLGLGVTAAFFLALELVLALCGVRAVLYEEDPFVGFAGHVPLFVEHTTPGGRAVWRTASNKRRLFNLQEFARPKPAGTVRVFCMSGSTTYGSPFGGEVSFCGWLRALLAVADPSRRWEVVNCGGLSYASYRVAHLMEELARREADLFIVYCGHNEFLERRTYGPMLDAPAPLLRAASLIARTRTGTLLKRGIDRLRKRSVTARTTLPAEVEAELDYTVGPEDYHRDDAWAAKVVAHYRLNLHRMVDIARAAGARILFVTPASNLRDCSPFKSEPGEGRDAEALYRAGQTLCAEGRYAEARQAFRRARDEDVCPLRATTAMVQIVREVAAERGVPLVDFARHVAEAAPHGIPGREQFLDHVHPTISVHGELARAIVATLAERGVLELAPGYDEGAIERVGEKIAARVDRRSEGAALRNLAKVLGWAGKFEESRRLALDALAVLGEDPESCFLVGVAACVLGDGEQAAAYLRRAIATSPGYGHAHYWLGETLAAQGRLEEAIAHFQRAEALLADPPEDRPTR